MILAFDIGNSITKIGIFRNDSSVPTVIARFPTSPYQQPNELHSTIQLSIINNRSFTLTKENISVIIISSVVKEIIPSYESWAQNYFGQNPIIITHRTPKRISIAYDTPEKIGSDRIANAEGAYKLYGESCLIIDLGTATTITILYKNVLIGGIIAPGVLTAAKSLYAHTSMLIEVNLSPPSSVIGKNTHDCIQSGLFVGWLSMIEGFVTKIFQQLQCNFPIIITGGISHIFAGHFSFSCVIDPLLTLKGIKAIAESFFKNV